MEWRSSEGIDWLEATLPGARVAFTTRTGGASGPPFDSLNLGILTGDVADAVLANRRRLAAALGLDPSMVAIARQVHGAELVTHAEPQDPSPFASPGKPIPDADGHVLTQTGPAALVFVADCLPVALAGPGGVALLHCGWRGLAAGIVERGAVAVGATDGAIGPGIGPCCYEVGAEVLDSFERLGPGVSTGDRLDLTEVARRLLREAGVERIEVAGHCTSCERDRFFSHRRDAGRTGRQAGVAWLEGG
jgi:YfiH family protein